nr:reverse transcriptase domain-containing protein [Tanacetum cinerariifolium]
MRTRSKSRNNSPQQETSQVIVEPLRIELPFLEDQFQEDPPPEVLMADNRTMAELLQAPTEGYEDAIQRFDESFYEAWDRFNDLLRVSPHHGFFELHQLDTFYNVLNVNDQNSLNSAASGNFLDKMPRECLKINESKSKVRQSRAKAVVAKVSTSSSTPAISSGVAELKDLVKALLLDKKNQSSAPTSSSTPASVKAVEPNCVTCGDMNFEISFMDALILMPKFASTLKVLIGNKEKLSEVARTPMNEHCLAVFLNKLPRKLGDPDKFLTPCEFIGMDECLALADLGASINLMTLSVWEALSLQELTPTCMTLELADRSVSKLIGIAKDVLFKVGVFHFPTDFVVVDFEPDPRVSLILGRCFLKTGRALIDVHKGELTLPNKIDVIDMASEEYSQEVLGFSDVTASGNPTPHDDLIVSTMSPTLTPSGDSDFLLFEEADAFLGLEDDPNSPKINPFYYDPKGDILLLEAILNSKPLPPLSNHEQYMPSFKKELKVCKAKTLKSSVDEPPEVELKDLPHHLEYAFLKGDNKLPIIIAKELGDEEKSALIKVLKSHKRAIAWKLFDIQEVEKFLDDGLIYPISDSPWVSLVHCVPKKGGFTIVENEENKLIPTRLVTGWRVCIDYRKLNDATRKDHFPLPFMDQKLERLAGNEYYCFLDGFSGCMLAIFHDMVEKTMEVFMDDFSVFGNSFKNCLSHLDKMLQRAKVDIIAKLPHPTTVKRIRSFLGHAGFYRRFIQDFSKISQPMTHLLKKNTSFIFSEDCIKAFQTLKKKLTEAPILIAPNWDLPFELMCDASDFAIGAVLGQRHDKHFKPIHYPSKTMTDAESNYITTEKEMLAVVYAFEKFWSY